ncbi:MAG: hypothetical protein ABSB69_19075, partial [Solirubrobacteraceae bacterium]
TPRNRLKQRHNQGLDARIRFRSRPASCILCASGLSPFSSRGRRVSVRGVVAHRRNRVRDEQREQRRAGG